MTEPEMTVELVRVYQFMVDGRLLCSFLAADNWHEIRERVVVELQRQFCLPEPDARKVWEHIRSST